MGIFDKFKQVVKDAADYRESYQKPIKEGQKDIGAFEKKFADEAGKTTDHGKALKKLDGDIKTAEAELKQAKGSRAKDAAEKVTAAETKISEAHTAKRDFLTGKSTVEIETTKKVPVKPKAAGKGAKAAEAAKDAPKAAAKTRNVTTKVEVSASKGLQDSFTKAEASAAKVTDPASSIFGTVRTQKDGWAKAVKANWNEAVAFKEGSRGMTVARGGILVGSAYALGDAVFRSQDSNGEERSAAGRIGQAVIAGAVGTAAAVSHRAVAR